MNKKFCSAQEVMKRAAAGAGHTNDLRSRLHSPSASWRCLLTGEGLTFLPGGKYEFASFPLQKSKSGVGVCSGVSRSSARK